MAIVFDGSEVSQSSDNLAQQISSPVVKIDVIQAELAQALINRPLDVLGRRVVLGVVVLERELGGQEYFGTGIRLTLEVPSEHLFIVPVHVGS